MRDSVIVLVIAFFMPVNFLTSSSGLIPVSGAILITRSPVNDEVLPPEGASANFFSYFGFDVPLINASMSSFRTLPSLPVDGTLEMSIPCFLAMLRTAGVASALLFDSSTFGSSLVL